MRRASSIDESLIVSRKLRDGILLQTAGRLWEQTKICHVLCVLLDRGYPGDVRTVHHDPKAEMLFLAWAVNH